MRKHSSEIVKTPELGLNAQMRSLLTSEDLLIAASAAIKDRRIRLRWRQIDLAKLSGIAPVTLRRFERTGKITFDGFAKIAAAIGLAESLVQLFRKRDEVVSSVAEFVKQGKRPKRVRLSRSQGHCPMAKRPVFGGRVGTPR